MSSMSNLPCLKNDRAQGQVRAFIIIILLNSKALASLCKCTDSPEFSLLAYTKYGCI